MRYAVTGAAGFIGSHLAETLAAAGHEVVGIDCFTDYYDARTKAENARDVDLRRLDLASDDVDLRGFDGVFHLAGRGGARSFGDGFGPYLRENVHATQRVAEAAVAAGVRVVFASSSSVYGDADRYPTPEDTPLAPLSPYGASKVAAEHVLHAYARTRALDVVVLRYFTVFGPRQRPDMAFTRIARALDEGRPFELHGDGSQSRGWTYVADAVDATIAAMARGRGTYNVGGGAEVSLREAIQAFERAAGRRLDLREHGAAAGDPGRTSADTSLIEAELEWVPRTSFEDGVRAQWEWVRQTSPP
jgi:nucleoside-diphosphate-sugar epimerase